MSDMAVMIKSRRAELGDQMPGADPAMGQRIKKAIEALPQTDYTGNIDGALKLLTPDSPTDVAAISVALAQTVITDTLHGVVDCPSQYFNFNLMAKLYAKVLARKASYTREELHDLLIAAWRLFDRSSTTGTGVVTGVLNQCEWFLARSEMDGRIEWILNSFKNSRDTNMKQKAKIDEMLGVKPDEGTINQPSDQSAIGKAIHEYVQAQPVDQKGAFIRFFNHGLSLGSSRPAANWLKKTAQMAGELDPAGHARLLEHIESRLGYPVMNYAHYDQSNRDLNIVRAIIFAGAMQGDKALAVRLGERCKSCYRQSLTVASSLTIATAIVYGLELFPKGAGVSVLANLKARVKNKTALKTISKAMEGAAKQAGMTIEQLEDAIVPAFELQPGGTRDVRFGRFTNRLVIESSSQLRQEWIDEQGRFIKSIPKEVKDGFPEELNALKAEVKDIQATLGARRQRLDSLMREDFTWEIAWWRKYYFEHPLLNWLVRRLIWKIEDAGATLLAGVLDGQLVDSSDNPLPPLSDAARVSLYHPIEFDLDVIVAWRDWVIRHQVVQPFKQAFREVYLLTPAEVETIHYSNRFAAHIIGHNQFMALAKERGWSVSPFGIWDGSGERMPVLKLPRWNISAEFWMDVASWDEQNDSGFFRFLATDQVRFHGTSPEPMRLLDVPKRVFSEVMRDVDLFVGVTSIGNNPQWTDAGDRVEIRDYWHHYSFGSLTPSGESRGDLLKALLPKLKIAKCASVEGNFLVVAGKIQTYKIHLNSGNILMEPGNRYLCIVPGSFNKSTSQSVFLPFEGDRMLSVILSKAFLLAEDDKIKDESIVRQLR